MKRIVVAGTGTGVGKTHISCALLRLARSGGMACIGLKPVESGVLDPQSGDAGALSAAGNVSVVALYGLPEPLSPHLAAQLNGTTIDLVSARRWVEQHEAQLQSAIPPNTPCVSVVELAGGLFTPLTATLTNLDLLIALEPCCFVLVASDRLGVLHDIGATIRAAAASHRAPDWIVLNQQQADHSTPFNLREASQLFAGFGSQILSADPATNLLPLLR